MDRTRERDEEKVKENLEGTRELPDDQDRPYTPPSGKLLPTHGSNQPDTNPQRNPLTDYLSLTMYDEPHVPHVLTRVAALSRCHAHAG